MKVIIAEKPDQGATLASIFQTKNIKAISKFIRMNCFRKERT